MKYIQFEKLILESLICKSYNLQANILFMNLVYFAFTFFCDKSKTIFFSRLILIYFPAEFSFPVFPITSTGSANQKMTRMSINNGPQIPYYLFR